ncbi:MAG: GNAT family N-acetyltransferase [Thermoplasmata archaeon]|nr:GNAT family N-acetyltransferase [Thermoplasmata archaeon]
MPDSDPDLVDVPGAPDIPGLVFRRYRGDEDLPTLVGVFNAAAETDGLDWLVTVDRLKVEYDNQPNFDPRKDVVIVEVDGAAVGFTYIYWFEETDGIFAAGHRERLVLEWSGKGIMRAQLAINEARAAELAAAHATGSKRMGTVTAESEVHRLRMLESVGFEKKRWYYEMLRDLREPIEVPPMPEGLEVRLVDPDDHRRIFDAAWEAFRESWGFREMKEKDYQRLTQGPEFQPELWVVAWDGDVVAGSVFCWVLPEENQRFDRLWGYNDDIAVTKAYRRRGLAKAMTSRSLVTLRDLGMEYANLGVDTQNPADALGLYEALGYRVRKTFFDLIRPMD